MSARVLAGLVGVALGSIAAVAHASPPEPSGGAARDDRSTRAPAMAPDPPPSRPLADALVVEPGLSCLDRGVLLEHLGSWRETLDVDARVAVRVAGSASDPHALAFVITVADEPVVERSFDPAPSDCADLHAVVALAIAIALDDTLASELGLVEPEGPPTPVEQALAGDGDLPAGPERPSPTRTGPVLGLTVAAGVFAGLTPGLSAGGLLAFDVRPRDHLDIRMIGLATHLPGFSLDEGEVAVTLAAGRVDVCWGTKPLAVRLRVCGGLAAGATISQARGFTENFTRTTPWFAGAAAVDLAVHLIGPLALELRVDGVVPFQRTQLDVRTETGQLLAREVFAVAGLIVAAGPRFEF